MTIWHPMKDAPKDTPVLLKVMSVTGERELDGRHCFYSRFGRWYRVSDQALLCVLPVAWADDK